MPDETRNPATENQRQTAVAVFGVGTMGAAVVRRLIGAGMTVAAWDRDPRAASRVARFGATVLSDPKKVVCGTSVVLTWLPTVEAVSEVMLSDQVVAAMEPGTIWAQMGTVGVGGTQMLDVELRTQRPDLFFVDAPVSGSRLPAESGQLLVLASGPEEAKPRLRPVFEAIGRRTLWLGAAGIGSRVKLVLNTWLAFEVEAAAEAAAVARRLGVNLEILAEAADGNPVVSRLASAKLAKIQSSDYSTDFALEWALKDLDLMRASVGAEHAPIAQAIADRWRTLVERGVGGLDVSAAELGLDGTANVSR